MSMIDLRIERMGAGGDGIATGPDGAPVYVPFALPGELVRVTPGARGAARLEAVLVPSPDRVAPCCPHHGICGNCLLQHWADAPYAAWKTTRLADALAQAGFQAIPLPPIARTPPRARRRADFALARREGRVVAGFHPRGGGPAYDLTDCPVLDPRLVALLPGLRAVLRQVPALRREGAAMVNLLDSGPDLLVRADAEPDQAARNRLIGFARAAGLSRIAWAAGRGRPEPVAVLRPPRITLSGVPVEPPPGAFLQASPQGEAGIVAATVAALDDLKGGEVIDLFAGIGTLSFALARRFRVRAVEGDAPALASLDRAARANGLGPRVRTECRDLARRPLMGGELDRCAAVVLDPPYTGAAPQVAAIAASRVRRVVYVSCNPAALARDAGTLRKAGFRAVTAVPVDQFLWSPHLESVGSFVRD